MDFGPATVTIKKDIKISKTPPFKAAERRCFLVLMEIESISFDLVFSSIPDIFLKFYQVYMYTNHSYYVVRNLFLQ